MRRFVRNRDFSRPHSKFQQIHEVIFGDVRRVDVRLYLTAYALLHALQTSELTKERDARIAAQRDRDAATAQLAQLERGVDARAAEIEQLEAKNEELLRQLEDERATSTQVVEN